jgi:hypothetical protein
MEPAPPDYSGLLEYIAGRTQHYEERYRLQRRGQAFLLWYAVEALGVDEDDAFVAVAADGGNDKGIDLFLVDHENESVIIAQGKFNERGNYTVRPGTLYELIHATDALHPETLRRDGRPDLADAAIDFQDAVSKGYTVDYHLVYMGPRKQEVVDAARQFNADFESSPGRLAHVVDLPQLHRIHDEHIDAAARIAEAAVRIAPGSAFEQEGDYGRSLVATVAGSELKRLHGLHGPALFDRNVRLYLGARKGSVNFGIRETLNSQQERQNFWAYNNGITIVCDDFTYDKSSGEITIRRFSIVNGCQTTVSIASSSEQAAEDVAVLARFIAVPDPQIVDQIIKYNNSQTKIRDWDLASQDRTQKGLKNRLAEEPHPFFYQLRRGEWTHLSAEDRQRFTRGGKHHIIEPDVLAQRLASFKGSPVPAYKDKSSLFTTHGRTVFPQDLRVEEVLLAWQAGEAAEVAVSRALIEARQVNDHQRVRILGRGGKTFVLAVMAIIPDARNGPEYIGRLRREVAGSRNTRHDLDIYAKVALSYYGEIMEDRIEAGNDLNQMVRSEDSFERIRSRVKSKWERDRLAAPFVEALPKLA